MPDHRVATPVLGRLAPGPSLGVVRSVGRATAYADFDGFVVALTAPGVALMPNGIALADRSPDPDWLRLGAPVQLGRGGLTTRGGEVAWASRRPPTWDPTVRGAEEAEPEAIRARGAAILAACGIDAAASLKRLAAALARDGLDPAARDGVALLLHSVAGRDPRSAAAAGARLLGRGQGLTPAGDDLLAATLATVAACAPTAGWSERERTAWLAGALPARLRAATTPLSATLLELAAAGQAIEPLHRLLDLGPGGDRGWPGAVRQLAGIGHSTGPCYAAATGAAALLCAA
ncbi:MAG: DUF2877 domain-containing protein [Actinobacteria bacterium]|nr:DUF2877 domain-containing protein [Actinomycetota bacterium]